MTRKQDGNEQFTDECPDCLGDGRYESDEYEPRGGHYNRAHACERCGGSGEWTATAIEWAESDLSKAQDEVVRLQRELSAAHARIVELTKALQSAPVVAPNVTRSEPITFGV